MSERIREIIRDEICIMIQDLDEDKLIKLYLSLKKVLNTKPQMTEIPISVMNPRANDIHVNTGYHPSAMG